MCWNWFHRYVLSNGGIDIPQISVFCDLHSDYSKMIWVYMVKNKDQVLDYFQKFYVAIEWEIGLSLKAVLSDSGSEYTYLFEEYYKKN